MKIYPGNNEVLTSEDITVNHIPLAYFTNVVKNIYPSIYVEDEFCYEKKIESPYPYQRFDSDNIYFFDEQNNPIDGTNYLKRNGVYYYFEPRDSVEFIPTEFTVNALVCRNDTYKTNLNYKLKIGCYSEKLAEKIIGLVNAENKNKPNNIIINDNGLLPESLINLSLNNLDFLFLNKEDLNSENLEEYLNSHVNLWLFDDTFDGCLSEDETLTEYELINPQIYQNSKSELIGYKRVKFDLNKVITLFPLSEYDYINIFNGPCPILIISKDNGSFIICSHPSILEHTDTCYNFIFEILMQVYLNSYFETKTRTNYIADNKIDYFIKLYQKFNQYHPRINLTEILLKDGFNTNINYNIVKIKTGGDDIVYTGTNKYKDLLFRKNSKTDPKKSDNTISVFTVNNTIINYDSSLNKIKTIEDKLDITYKNIDGTNHIEISSFKSSKYKINKEYAQLIEIRDNSEYVLCFDSSSNSFFLVRSIIYDESKYGIKFATIKLDYTEQISCGDIRSWGGGESDNSDPNYEMIDTGSLKGRPYRLGSTMIIKLPKRFESKKDILEKELQKHISSGDYFILVFED